MTSGSVKFLVVLDTRRSFKCYDRRYLRFIAIFGGQNLRLIVVRPRARFFLFSSSQLVYRRKNAQLAKFLCKRRKYAN